MHTPSPRPQAAAQPQQSTQPILQLGKLRPRKVQKGQDPGQVPQPWWSGPALEPVPEEAAKVGQAGNWLSESSFLIWSVFDLFPSLNRGPHLLTSRLLLHPWSFVRVWHLEDTHRHTHTKNDGEKVPSESTGSPYLTSGPHLPGQVRMAAPSHFQPLPSGQPLPRGPAACTPSPVVAVAIHGWVQRAGLHGDKCLVLQAKPCLCLSAGPCPKVLTPACGWTAQPGTEYSWVGVPSGAVRSVSP